jgi:hypothetical protein
VLLGAGIRAASRSHLIGLDNEDVENSELDELTQQAVTVGSDS